MRWIFAILFAAIGFAQSPADLQRAAAEKQRQAAEVQRQATRIQYAGSAFAGFAPAAEAAANSPPAAAPECEALDEDAIGSLIETASKLNQLQPALLRAVIERESAFKPCAVSAKGAKGLMQLMPATAAQFNVRDVFDPGDNIAAGAKYLKQLIDRFGGDLTLALGAYNAGPAAVEQAGGIPDFAETRDYVKAIVARIKRPDPPQSPTPTPTGN